MRYALHALGARAIRCLHNKSQFIGHAAINVADTLRSHAQRPLNPGKEGFLVAFRRVRWSLPHDYDASFSAPPGQVMSTCARDRNVMKVAWSHRKCQLASQISPFMYREDHNCHWYTKCKAMVIHKSGDYCRLDMAALGICGNLISQPPSSHGEICPPLQIAAVVDFPRMAALPVRCSAFLVRRQRLSCIAALPLPCMAVQP